MSCHRYTLNSVGLHIISINFEHARVLRQITFSFPTLDRLKPPSNYTSNLSLCHDNYCFGFNIISIWYLFLILDF